MNSRDQLPLVTLGMPVYNEAKFLVESVENLLKQTYPHLEIIISDNGSTDQTEKICREYADKFPQITYIRQKTNIGQQNNFNFLPHQGTGKYFCWVSGHDLLDPDFVEKSVAVLESNPAIVLAYPRTIYMREDGSLTGEKYREFDIRGMSASRRFREVMWRVDCNYVYGTFRLAPMKESHLFQTFPAPDRVFLAEMAIKGTFAPVETQKYYRPNRGMKQQTEIEKRHRLMSYLYPGKKFTDRELEGNDFYAPTVLGYHHLVRDSKLPFLTRVHLHLSVWLAGVMKFHLFPGADMMSVIIKKVLPKPLLKRLMGKMQ